MKILFITPSYKPAYIYGGTIVAVSTLAERLVRLGNIVTVYTTRANGNTELDVVAGAETMVEGVKVIYFNRVTKDHTHVSFALWKHLDKTINQFDVVHIHSWWNLLVIGSAWICRRRGINPVLSPHGMFSEFILNHQNRRKKKLIHFLVGRGLLEGTFLHVSTQMEWSESLKMNPKWDGRIIPNLIKLGEIELSNRAAG